MTPTCPKCPHCGSIAHDDEPTHWWSCGSRADDRTAACFTRQLEQKDARIRELEAKMAEAEDVAVKSDKGHWECARRIHELQAQVAAMRAAISEVLAIHNETTQDSAMDHYCRLSEAVDALNQAFGPADGEGGK